ncbi:Iterative polyketide synthase afoE [Talaromyces pinophilus]|nr:Iterative polyketide synthase afoE [Talaromyces pinophilus]
MPNLVYQHHTIADLSKRLHNLLNNSSGPDPEESQKNSNEMEKIIDLYTAGLPMRTNKILGEPYIAGDVHNHAVLLTGSTGSLGSHVLRQLVKLPNVSKIYCFVRSRSVWRNHGQSHDDEHEGKIERVSVDYTRPRFGLSEDVYSQLLLDVNVIICLAWKVDFNVSLQAFEADCIHSIRAFVDFNLQSRLNPRIVFASSTIYALSHACIQGASTVPEDIISPPSIDTGTWYGQSKEVAERILAYSAKHSGVPVSILRLGQNSSAEEESSTSSWLNQEWIPSLVHTSKTLKVVPNLKTPINWVPVDRMANIILDLTFVGKDPSKSSDDENRARQASVYNIVHPRPIPWSRFAQVLSQMLPGCKIVTLRQWIEIVKIHSESSQHKHKEALKTIPAVKLISFFEYMSMHEDSLGSRSVGIITDKAISQSTALSSIPEIGDDSLEKWARM